MAALAIKAFRSLVGLGKHPNVGAVLIVSLGCEHMDGTALAAEIKASGKPVERIVVQECGGTLKTMEAGTRIAYKIAQYLTEVEQVEIAVSDLIVGVECGGSDATSGLAANPAVSIAMDMLVDNGGTCMVEEFMELLGCQSVLAERAVNEEVGRQIVWQ